MNLLKLDLVAALLVVSRTLPFVFLQVAICTLTGLLVILNFGLLLFIARMAGSTLALDLGLLLSAGLWLMAFFLCDRFILLRFRVAHLLAAGELLQSGRLPAAPLARFSLAKIPRRIAGHALPYFQKSIRRALRAVDRGELASCSGKKSAVFTGLAAVLCAAALLSGKENPHDAACKQVALYARRPNFLRRQALLLRLGELAIGTALFLLLLLPLQFLSGSSAVPVLAGALLAAALAALLELAFFRPLTDLAKLSGFLRETPGLLPDSGCLQALAERFFP